jgi:hypothetical protein
VSVPAFDDVLVNAERKLTSSLGGRVRVELFDVLDDGLVKVIESIDHKKFRRELWYSRDDLNAYAHKEGFVCLVVYFVDIPVAFNFGYADSEEGGFFSDNAATLIEKKGIGSVLTILEMYLCYHRGYRSIRLLTEEVDESDRRLRAYWERFGYRVTSVGTKGIEMRTILDPESLAKVYNKFGSS